MSNYQLVVADLYKLTGRVNGKYSPEGGKQLVRSKIVVRRSDVEQVNEEFVTNNRYYEIDEEATIEYNEVTKPKMIEERAQKAALQNQNASDILAAAIKTASSANVETPKKSTKKETKPENAPKYPEGKPNEEWTKKELQSWMDGAGIEYDKRAGVEKLLTTIEELKLKA